MSDKRSAEILDFWFGPLKSETDYPPDKARMWFSGTEEVNEMIRVRFAGDLEKASAGAYDHWRKTPRECLALILILDQFTRNLHDGPEAFAQDSLALALALEAVAKHYDEELYPLQRCFIYLPFEHSEDIEMQEKSVALFTRLAEKAPPAIEFPLAVMLDYAKKHHEIIKKFGRFPHRNAALGRKSTPQEIEFLKTPGSSF